MTLLETKIKLQSSVNGEITNSDYVKKFLGFSSATRYQFLNTSAGFFGKGDE